MVQQINWKKFAFKSLVVMGLWTIVILLISSITFLQSLQEGMPLDAGRTIFFELLCLSPWIVLTPLIIWLARTYNFQQKNLTVPIAVHMAAMGGIFIIHTLVQSYIVSVQYDMAFTFSYLQLDFVGFLDMRVMMYGGILLAVYGVDFHKKNRQIKMCEPRLKADLNRAKFQALLNNIQPDFMLKTLDAISDNLEDDRNKAESILTDFSDLLRIMLNSIKQEVLPIREDLKSFHLYFDLLQKRTSTPIKKEVNIEEECYDALVPSFLILLPLIEEIFQLAETNGKAVDGIRYQAHLINNNIKLNAVFSGTNLPSFEPPEMSRNIGIKEMIKRLQVKYGKRVDFKITTNDESLGIHLTIPFLQTKEANSQQFVSPHLNAI